MELTSREAGRLGWQMLSMGITGGVCFVMGHAAVDRSRLASGTRRALWKLSELRRFDRVAWSPVKANHQYSFSSDPDLFSHRPIFAAKPATTFPPS